MDRHIDVKPLSGRLVQKAYPFASALGLEDPEIWREFVDGFGAGAAAESGAVAALDDAGYVRGVLFYHVNRHRKRAPSLVCDPFLVAEMPGYEPTVRALLAAADRAAVRQGCKWVRVVLPAWGDPLDGSRRGCGPALLRSNFALESMSFRRRRTLPMHAESKSVAPGVATGIGGGRSRQETPATRGRR